MTKRDTFDNLESWFGELETFTANRDVVKLILGNKIDKEEDRQVKKEEGERLAEKKGCLFAECSAKARLGVHPAMEHLVQLVFDFFSFLKFDLNLLF